MTILRWERLRAVDFYTWKISAIEGAVSVKEEAVGLVTSYTQSGGSLQPKDMDGFVILSAQLHILRRLIATNRNCLAQALRKVKELFEKEKKTK